MSQSFKNKSLHLPHRHTCYDPKRPDLNGVYDDVVLMNERAQAVIHMVQNELFADRTLEDSVLFATLETVHLELEDINALLGHFVEWQNHHAKK